MKSLEKIYLTSIEKFLDDADTSDLSLSYRTNPREETVSVF